jgi:hypothetical protein
MPEERVADIHIVVRMDPSNEQPADYYLLPSIDMELPELPAVGVQRGIDRHIPV